MIATEKGIIQELIYIKIILPSCIGNEFILAQYKKIDVQGPSKNILYKLKRKSILKVKKKAGPSLTPHLWHC